MKEILKKIGSWLFLIGILVSVIIGLIIGANWYADPNSYMAGLLAVLGFVVGLLSFFAMGSITHEKVPTFLIAAFVVLYKPLTLYDLFQLHAVYRHYQTLFRDRHSERRLRT